MRLETALQRVFDVGYDYGYVKDMIGTSGLRD